LNTLTVLHCIEREKKTDRETLRDREKHRDSVTVCMYREHFQVVSPLAYFNEVIVLTDAFFSFFRTLW